MPKETKGSEQGQTYGRVLLMDRASFQASQSQIGHPKRDIFGNAAGASFYYRGRYLQPTMQGLYACNVSKHMAVGGSGQTKGFP